MQEKVEKHLINIRSAIESVKGSLEILKTSDLDLDGDELKKELKILEEKERELILKLEQNIKKKR